MLKLGSRYFTLSKISGNYFKYNIVVENRKKKKVK